MQALNNKATGYSHQSGPISWKTVPEFIQNALSTQGCTLLKHHRDHPHHKHIRFQYVPLSYQGCLYYLQKWSRDEWGVSPCQIIFPAEGACSFEALNDSSLLSSVVQNAVARFYGNFPEGSLLQPSLATQQYANGSPSPLASCIGA